MLGPNGAGKTTTLRMISTALKPDEGSITIAGNDIVKNRYWAVSLLDFYQALRVCMAA
ncbi:sodium ABC exporter ATP-binding protein [Pseudoalteromonas distincta]|nr:sodium ABC exporter ATP-binding protein [Pseudoalteromonas distincta]